MLGKIEGRRREWQRMRWLDRFEGWTPQFLHLSVAGHCFPEGPCWNWAPGILIGNTPYWCFLRSPPKQSLCTQIPVSDSGENPNWAISKAPILSPSRQLESRIRTSSLPKANASSSAVHQVLRSPAPHSTSAEAHGWDPLLAPFLLLILFSLSFFFPAAFTLSWAYK